MLLAVTAEGARGRWSTSRTEGQTAFRRRTRGVLATARRVLACSALAACGGEGPAAPRAADPQAALQRFADSVVRADALPGLVVAVGAAGAAPIVVASGWADVAARRPLGAEDRFRLGSVTKPMVATVVLQLADEGRLALDDTLGRWLPGLLPGSARVNLRQLLNHTSGIPNYTATAAFAAAQQAAPDRVWTSAALVELVRDVPPLFAPGAPGRWSYSNTNYVLLGLVAEAAGGQPIAELLRARVFAPLGMTATYLGTTPALDPPFAQGYASAAGNVAIGTLVNPTAASAAGAVVGTARDVQRFVEALADGRLVSPAAHAARLTTVPASRLQLPGEATATEYGLGVIVGDGWIGHDGAIAGYESQAHAKPGVGSVVVLVNRSAGLGVARRVAARLRGRIAATP